MRLPEFPSWEYSKIERTWETTSAQDVANMLSIFSPQRAENNTWESVVVIERFVGAGPRTREAIHTLRFEGFFEYYARLLGYQVHLQAPQWRKAYLGKARELVGGGQHYTDAMAHVLYRLEALTHV